MLCFDGGINGWLFDDEKSKWTSDALVCNFFPFHWHYIGSYIFIKRTVGVVTSCIYTHQTHTHTHIGLVDGRPGVSGAYVCMYVCTYVWTYETRPQREWPFSLYTDTLTHAHMCMSLLLLFFACYRKFIIVLFRLLLFFIYFPSFPLHH